MRLIGGIRTDSLPIDNAPNSWIDGRNGVLSKKYASFSNEDGFLKINTTGTYNLRTDLVPVGAIPVSNGYLVVFSISYSGSTRLGSEIGFIDNTDAETYTAAVTPAKDTTDSLGFTWNHQITGEAKLNNQGEIVCAFTDDNVTPKVINLQQEAAKVTFNIEDILMFPEFTGLSIATSILDSGGSVPSAAYFITAKYEDSDGTQTNNTGFTDPAYIFRDSLSNTYTSITGNTTGIATNKAIKIAFSDLDTNYTYLIISCIKVENGIATAHIINKVPVTGTTMDYVFTGQETLEDITLLEIQSKQDWVVKAKCITQVDRQLFLGNIEYGVDIDYQKYALDIDIKWESAIRNAITTAESAKTHDYNSDVRTFMHDEVKAFYIVFELMNGSFSKAYHIAGRDAENIQHPTALNVVNNGEVQHIGSFGNPATPGTLANTYGLGYDDSLNAGKWRYFQTRCTAKTDGTMGYWENESEVYPNDPNFDASGIGGRNLIGTKVKHHRFPDINWLKQYGYLANDEYGRTQLDTLRIDVSNVVIPADLIGIVKNWQIYYADPTPENSLVATNDILHSLAIDDQEAYNINNVRYNTGGNWTMRQQGTTNDLFPPNVNSYNEKYKCHGFDLINKPSLGSTYVKTHLGFGYGNNAILLLTDTTNPDTCTGYIDYTSSTLAAIPIFTPETRRIRKVVNDQYIPNNADININGVDIINVKSESAYYFELQTLTYLYDDVINYFPAGSNVHERNTINLLSTGSMLYSLMQYKTNLYTNFYTQASFVSAGDKIPITSSGTKTGRFTCGDAVIADLCYTAYGLYDLAANLPSTDQRDGVRVYHRYIAPCRQNISLRYQDGTAYSTFYPKTGNVETLRYDMNMYTDPVVAYNQDYSKLNNFDVIEPFNYILSPTYDRPFRILKGVPMSGTETFETWRQWLNNDFYELTHKNGEIWNLQGLSSGELLIQNNSLYKTRSIGRLDTSVVETILGSGDIFQFPPQEIIPDNNGYIGSQHRIASKLTKYGYVSIDAELGRIFIVGETANELTAPAKGMRNFFRDYSKVDFGTLLEVDDNPITSAGINIEYDEKFNRLLVSKKQFELTAYAEEFYVDSATADMAVILAAPLDWAEYAVGATAIIYKDYANDGFKYFFVIYDTINAVAYEYYFSYGHEPVDNFFIEPTGTFWSNTGFTISYSFDFECWVNYHDYFPDYIFRTRNKLWSFNNSQLYSHNNPLVKAIYYNYDNEVQGTPYQTYIVPVFNDNPMLAKLFYNINWINYLIDSNDFTHVDDTFDKMLIWDSKQCSGEFNIDKFTTLSNIYTENCRKVKETWFLNRFRDYILDHSAKFIEGGNGVEYTEISANIDITQEVQLNKRFVDKWMAVKCIYDNTITDDEQFNWFLQEIDVLTQIIRR